MKTTIYANYGMLAHEHQTVYTAANYCSTCYDEIAVNIPERFNAYETVLESIAIKIDGIPYLLDEVLDERNGKPVIRWNDGFENHYFPLEIVNQ